MKATDLDFMTCLHIAECAAQVFNRHRPEEGDKGIEWVRARLRQSSVATLRWLWKSGDYDTRMTVAARVLAWKPKEDPDFSGVIKRIQDREKARTAK